MGNKRGHKGGHRRFTNPAEIALQKEKEEREKEWRRKRGETIESESEEDDDNSQESESEEEEKPTKNNKKSSKQVDDEEDESEEDESEEEDDEPLIEICNPNRMPVKPKKDVNAVANEKVTLTRKEREQLEEQKAKTQVNKSQMERDLARLALIKQKREEAAKKRETDLAKPQASGSKSVAKK